MLGGMHDLGKADGTLNSQGLKTLYTTCDQLLGFAASLTRLRLAKRLRNKFSSCFVEGRDIQLESSIQFF